MNDRPVVVDVDHRGVLTATLVDEANRNALSGPVVDGLLAALARAAGDDAVRVVVVTNTGRVFCAGADLSARSGEPAAADPTGSFVELLRAIRSTPVPVVGRIAGHCVAGGMGLAAAFDLAVAVDDARFGFTEVRIGVAPAVISVLCLPRMRPADAAEVFLRGSRFGAPRAAELGLITRAVPAADLDGEVEAIVSDLLAGGPNALAATKRLLTEVPGLGEDEAFAMTAALSAELFAGDEAAAGMAAFLEKRPAPWVPGS